MTTTEREFDVLEQTFGKFDPKLSDGERAHPRAADMARSRRSSTTGHASVGPKSSNTSSATAHRSLATRIRGRSSRSPRSSASPRRASVGSCSPLGGQRSFAPAPRGPTSDRSDATRRRRTTRLSGSGP